MSLGIIPLPFHTIALCAGICQGQGMHAILPGRERSENDAAVG
jgi:dihydroxyacid dehydratase/phosphogluconate dehydratase